MKLYKVTFSGRRHIGNWIVAAGCKKQAVGLIVNHLNWRRQLRGITYQTTDFYAKKSILIQSKSQQLLIRRANDENL